LIRKRAATLRRLDHLYLFFSVLFFSVVLMAAVLILFSFPPDFGRSLFEACLAACPQVWHLAGIVFFGERYLIAAALLVLFIFSLLRTSFRLARVRAFCRCLEAAEIPSRLRKIMEELALKEQQLRFFGSDLSFAFTSGLWRPRMFVSSRLVESLSDDEVMAVLLHEMSHLRRKDLLRGTIVSFIANFFFFLPAFKNLGAAFRKISEFLADENALSSSLSPACLAAVLVKVKRESLAAAGNFTSFASGDFVDERLARILDIRQEKRSVPFPWRNVAVSIFFTLFLALGFLPAEKIFGRRISSACQTSQSQACCFLALPAENHGLCHL